MLQPMFPHVENRASDVDAILQNTVSSAGSVCRRLTCNKVTMFAVIHLALSAKLHAST
jgi:hypothetical protein